MYSCPPTVDFDSFLDLFDKFDSIHRYLKLYVD